MKRPLGVAIAVAVMASSSSFGADQWTMLGQLNDKSTLYFKQGSFNITKTKEGVPVATIDGRIDKEKSSKAKAPKPILLRWQVSIDDCRNKRGKLVETNMAGAPQFVNSFVLGDGTVASQLAQIICGSAQLNVRESSR
ncbi:MAG: hypothetical protein HY900_03465 [Deltaproteobacteria bacterium]|nr:hypothetical protein [Deltaproteobacteria bacterium]